MVASGNEMRLRMASMSGGTIKPQIVQAKQEGSPVLELLGRWGRSAGETRDEQPRNVQALFACEA